MFEFIEKNEYVRLGPTRPGPAVYPLPAQGGGDAAPGFFLMTAETLVGSPEILQR